MGGNHDHSIDQYERAPGSGATRPLRIGVGGPVGTGKTTLVASLCEQLRDAVELVVVTNDIFTDEDAKALRDRNVLMSDRIVAVQTGCCPHTAIRDDISANLTAMTALEQQVGNVDITLLESGGDNLTAIFSQGLVDLQIFVIDACGGDDIPRKGGPGISKADLLVVNKTDLAHLVGSDLELMAKDAGQRRGDKPTFFSTLREPSGASDIAAWVLHQHNLWSPKNPERAANLPTHTH